MTDENQGSQPRAEIPASDDAPREKYVSSLPGVLGMIDTAISNVESVMLGAGVLLMAINTSANVLGRFVFQNSLFFSEELNSILIIFITFAGISYAARHGRHIRMSAFFDVMPYRMRKTMMIIITITTAIFMLGLAWYSLQYLLAQAGRGRIMPALKMPVWIMLVWVPVGFFMTGLQYLLTAIKNMIERDIYLSTNVLEGYEDNELEI